MASSASNDARQNDKVSADARKIFVGGLHRDTGEQELRDYFGKYGDIEYVSVKVDVNTGLSRGFAFIVFESSEALDKVEAAGDHIINGKKVDPKKARTRPGRIFVGGLSPELTDDDIKTHFAQFGKITEAQMPFDKIKNRRKAFCFILFESDESLKKLLRNPQQNIKGVEVNVTRAEPKPDQLDGSMTGSQGGRGGMRGARGGQGGYGNQGFHQGDDRGFGNYGGGRGGRAGGYGMQGLNEDEQDFGNYGGYEQTNDYNGRSAYRGGRGGARGGRGGYGMQGLNEDEQDFGNYGGYEQTNDYNGRSAYRGGRGSARGGRGGYGMPGDEDFGNYGVNEQSNELHGSAAYRSDRGRGARGGLQARAGYGMQGSNQDQSSTYRGSRGNIRGARGGRGGGDFGVYGGNEQPEDHNGSAVYRGGRGSIRGASGGAGRRGGYGGQNSEEDDAWRAMPKQDQMGGSMGGRGARGSMRGARPRAAGFSQGDGQGFGNYGGDQANDRSGNVPYRGGRGYGLRSQPY